MSARTLVIALIIALAIYLLWQVLRYLRLRNPKSKSKVKGPLGFNEPHLPGDEDDSDAHVSLSMPTVPVDDPDDDFTRFAPDALDDERMTSSIQHAVERRGPRPPAEPDASSFGFDALLEMRQMRHLVDTLRARMDTQHEEIERLRNAVEALQASQRIAPLYSEAVALARRGHDAQSIAERCGISVSEAELVRALAANPEEPSA